MTPPHPIARFNKLLRASGPSSYRLMAVEMSDGVWFGETRGGDTLKDDIASYRDRRVVCKPLYAVFVRPHPIARDGESD